MKILIIIDQYGWSYDQLARGYKAYSKHDIEIVRLDEVTEEILKNADVIFVFSWINIATLQEKFAEILKEKGIVTGSWSHIVPTREEYKRYTKKGDLEQDLRQEKSKLEGLIHVYNTIIEKVDTPSDQREFSTLFKTDAEKRIKEIEEYINILYPDLSIVKLLIITDKTIYDKIIYDEDYVKYGTKFFFSVQPTDTNVFKPLNIKHEFRIGWCGNSTRPDKRVYLLDKLKYSVEKRSLWGEKYFIKDRSSKELNDWYNNLDVYISVSDATIEGGASLTILEAMACGLPVISTAHGSEVENILGVEWIVPCIPEEEVIKQINEKLDLLRNNPELRKCVGERNRKYIEEYCAWSKIAKNFDEFFNQLEFRYIKWEEVPKEKLQVFLNTIKEEFINDSEDTTLYLNGDWKINGDGTISFRDGERYGYACLNKNGEVIGYWTFMWLPKQYGYGERTTGVFEAMVDKHYRGLGIGKQLYELVELLGRKMKVERFFVAEHYDLNGKPLSKLVYIALKNNFKAVDERIISEPEALKLKYSQEWNKRIYLQRRLVKELNKE